MVKNQMLPAPEMSDAELVTRSLAGDRTAFGQIVARYQTLICSLAYNATGSLATSEDLSQETFIAAWQQLPKLREPGKLRSWLCGIVRNLNHRTARAQQREPLHRAETLDSTHRSPAIEPLPRDQAISREEEAILWRSLERIPDNYREPLILFYREQQSIEQVAQGLELSEEVVRQRLSRGRKLLQEEIASFVEGALLRSAPGSSFSGNVLAALPLNAAGLTAGLGTAKGGLLSFLTFPLIGLLASFAGSIGIVRDAPLNERPAKQRLITAMWIDCAGMSAGLWLSHYFRARGALHDRTFVNLQLACYLIWAAIMAPLVIVSVRQSIASYLKKEFTATPSAARKPKLSVLITACAMTVGALAWLVHLAWQVNDMLSFLAATGTGAAIIAWCVVGFYFPGLISKLPLSPAKLAWVPTILIVGVTLFLVNGRLDRWIAVIRGGNLAEANLFLPMWTVHLSTLLLLSWIGIGVVITKPKKL